MKLGKLIIRAGGLLVIAVVFGCTPAVKPAAEQRVVPPAPAKQQPVAPVAPATTDTSHPRAKLIVGSGQLAGKVVITDPRFRSVGRLNQAEVTVKNLTETRYALEYKFEWQDKQGFSIDSGNVWHPFTLTPLQTRRFQSTGKTPQASAIIFMIRFPDDAFSESY